MRIARHAEVVTAVASMQIGLGQARPAHHSKWLESWQNSYNEEWISTKFNTESTFSRLTAKLQNHNVRLQIAFIFMLLTYYLLQLRYDTKLTHLIIIT